ncbi:unnamed protein product [Ceutorhynchus assimilis]|uniref:Uncharacterized protein n=1 Tax=Ceutorhynchus assimilis TaxID=467358 RepID=A0A9N9QK49_9CUCU|nr:unnamed protein product [Ceutorhynchus assimilis]
MSGKAQQKKANAVPPPKQPDVELDPKIKESREISSKQFYFLVKLKTLNKNLNESRDELYMNKAMRYNVDKDFLELLNEAQNSDN